MMMLVWTMMYLTLLLLSRPVHRAHHPLPRIQPGRGCAGAGDPSLGSGQAPQETSGAPHSGGTDNNSDITMVRCSILYKLQ